MLGIFLHCEKPPTLFPCPNPNSQKNWTRPIALTSFIIKNLRKILKGSIFGIIDGNLDPLQFAYQVSKGLDDAKIFILDKIHQHLEIPWCHARILFADLSPALNNMQPHILIERFTSNFKLLEQFLLLILNFLTERVQRVFVNGLMLDCIPSNPGLPQGFVLSLWLWS